MRYYYVDENGQTSGPEEESAFYEALHQGQISGQTLVTAEDAENWQPLSAVLEYYFTLGGETKGPMPLAKLEHVAATTTEPLMVLEPGGAEWKLLSSLLPAPDEPALAPLPRVVAVVVPSHAPVQSLPQIVVPPPQDPGPRPRFPAALKIAGVIWMLFGAARTLVSGMGFVRLKGMAEAVHHLENDNVRVGVAMTAALLVLIPFFIGLVFLGMGYRTFTGRTPDVIGKGIGSILLGIVFSVLMMSAYEPDRLGRVFLVDAVINGTLVVAGIFVLAERRRFLAWRRWSKPVFAGRRW